MSTSVDKFGYFSVDLKRRVKTTEGLFIDEDGNLNAQNKLIKNGTKLKRPFQNRMMDFRNMLGVMH